MHPVSSMSARQVYAADTLDGLLDFSQHVDTFSPAFGLVHHGEHDGHCEHRFLMLIPPRMWHAIDPHGKRLGEVFYDRIAHGDWSSIRENMDSLRATGWMVTASSWYVEDPESDDVRLVDHPRRQSVLSTWYLEHDTGQLTYRQMKPPSTRAERIVQPRPDEGWTVDNVGTIVAAMDLVRCGVLGA